MAIMESPNAPLVPTQHPERVDIGVYIDQDRSVYVAPNVFYPEREKDLSYTPPKWDADAELAELVEADKEPPQMGGLTTGENPYPGQARPTFDDFSPPPQPLNAADAFAAGYAGRRAGKINGETHDPETNRELRAKLLDDKEVRALGAASRAAAAAASAKYSSPQSRGTGFVSSSEWAQRAAGVSELSASSQPNEQVEVVTAFAFQEGDAVVNPEHVAKPAADAAEITTGQSQQERIGSHVEHVLTPERIEEVLADTAADLGTLPEDVPGEYDTSAPLTPEILEVASPTEHPEIQVVKDALRLIANKAETSSLDRRVATEHLQAINGILYNQTTPNLDPASAETAATTEDTEPPLPVTPATTTTEAATTSANDSVGSELGKGPALPLISRAPISRAESLAMERPRVPEGRHARRPEETPNFTSVVGSLLRRATQAVTSRLARPKGRIAHARSHRLA